jgi:hypothetical protein
MSDETIPPTPPDDVQPDPLAAGGDIPDPAAAYRNPGVPVADLEATTDPTPDDGTTLESSDGTAEPLEPEVIQEPEGVLFSPGSSAPVLPLDSLKVLQVAIQAHFHKVKGEYLGAGFHETGATREAYQQVVFHLDWAKYFSETGPLDDPAFLEYASRSSDPAVVAFAKRFQDEQDGEVADEPSTPLP